MKQILLPILCIWIFAAAFLWADHHKQTATAQYRIIDGVYLNDTIATPGVVLTKDSAVICHQKTSLIRHVTPAMHRFIFKEYGINYAIHLQYEDDHLISLELGGSNDNRNRWPQPYLPKPGAREKDKVETYLHNRICAGTISVDSAQYAISHNWYAVYLSMGDNDK